MATDVGITFVLDIIKLAKNSCKHVTYLYYLKLQKYLLES